MNDCPCPFILALLRAITRSKLKRVIITIRTGTYFGRVCISSSLFHLSPLFPRHLERVLQQLELQMVPVPRLPEQVERVVPVDPAEDLVQLRGHQELPVENITMLFMKVQHKRDLRLRDTASWLPLAHAI